MPRTRSRIGWIQPKLPIAAAEVMDWFVIETKWKPSLLPAPEACEEIAQVLTSHAPVSVYGWEARNPAHQRLAEAARLLRQFAFSNPASPKMVVLGNALDEASYYLKPPSTKRGVASWAAAALLIWPLVAGILWQGGRRKPSMRRDSYHVRITVRALQRMGHEGATGTAVEQWLQKCDKQIGMKADVLRICADLTRTKLP